LNPTYQHFHPADLKKFWTNEMVGVKAQLPNVKEVSHLSELS
jgi:hypothetical protein